MLLLESSDVINKLAYDLESVLLQCRYLHHVCIRLKHVYKCYICIKRVPFKARRIDWPPAPYRQMVWRMNTRAHLELWAGFPLLFEIRKCFETVQQQVDTASARLRCVRFCFCVARIMRAREGGAEGRVSWWGFGGFYYGGYSVLVILSWGSLMASSATITQWNTTTAVSSSIQPCVNSDIQCLWMFIWSLLRDNSFTHTLYLINEKYNLPCCSVDSLSILWWYHDYDTDIYHSTDDGLPYSWYLHLL